MRKLLALSTALLALTSCSQSLQKVATAIRDFGEPKPREVKQETIESAKEAGTIREYLSSYGYKLVPIGANETLVVARNLDSGVDANWNVIPKLYAFCKAHGGELLSGEGIEAVSYDSVNGKREAFRYFGLNTKFRCEGGSYPFEVEHIKGRAGHHSSVYGWVAEALVLIKHKPEPTVNTAFAFPKEEMDRFSQETLSQFVNEAYDKGAIKRKLLKLGNERWKGMFSVRNPTPSYVVRKMKDRMGFLWYALEYCQAQGGELQKDGKSFTDWFTKFVKTDKFWGYPYHLAGSGTVYPLAGMYACVGGNQLFEMKVKPSEYSSSWFYYEFFLQSGNREYQKLYGSVQKEERSETTAVAPVPKQTQTQPNVQQPFMSNPLLTGGLLTKIFAAKAVAMKSDLEKQQGAVTYKAYYNGVDGSGCELASVVVNNAGSVTVYNYRVCNGAISDYTESSLNESIPKEVKEAELRVAKLARDYGAYALEINGYRLYGRALRDKDYCLVEVRVLENGRNLVRIDRMDGCR